LWLSYATLAAGAVFAQEKSPKLYWFIPDGFRADTGEFDIFRFAREGRYPHIRRMMEQGSYGYSIPTYPSHTPTNFATLLTGTYPEVHGVADGPMHVEGHPLARPSVMGFSSTARRAEPVWKIFEDFGWRVALASLPGSTPPELNAGVTLRGRWGRWGSDFFAINFESKQEASRPAGGAGDHLFYMGPKLTRYEALRPAQGWENVPPSNSAPREMTLSAYGDTLFAYVYDASDDGKTNYSRVLISRDKKTVLADFSKENQWSGWLPVRLSWQEREVSSHVNVSLIKLDDDGFLRMRAYYDLLNRSTIHPSELAESMGEAIGPMVDFVDNWPAQLNRYAEDKAAFLTEAGMALDWHRRLVPFLFSMPETPDVIIHDTYVPNQALESRWWLQFVDPESESYGAVSEAERAALREELHGIYAKIDAILGEALDKGGDDTLIVLSSDHGVIPLKRYVLLNNLFAKEGLLKFKIEQDSGEAVVDWENTKAVHLKMHGIYLHPKGLAGDWTRGRGRAYRRLRKKVRGLVKSLRFEETAPIKDVLDWEDADRLRLPKDRVADLILVMRPGFGLSETITESGELFRRPLQSGYKQALVADDVPGLWTPFIVMGPGVKRGLRIPSPIRHVDQAPTLLRLLGVPVPARMQGRVVSEIMDSAVAAPMRKRAPGVSHAAWSVKSDLRRGDWSGGGAGFRTMVAVNGERTLRVESARGLSDEEFETIVKDKTAVLNALYAGPVSYPGQVTRTFSVPHNLRPERVDRNGFPVFVLRATKSLAYGTGAEDMAAYRAVLTYARCGNVLNQLELFVPEAAFDKDAALEQLDAIGCKIP
jgi:predicted AlkP superfamily phosphohydrolase/phosphomutase